MRHELTVGYVTIDHVAEDQITPTAETLRSMGAQVIACAAKFDNPHTLKVPESVAEALHQAGFGEEIDYSTYEFEQLQDGYARAFYALDKGPRVIPAHHEDIRNCRDERMDKGAGYVEMYELGKRDDTVCAKIVGPNMTPDVKVRHDIKNAVNHLPLGTARFESYAEMAGGPGLVIGEVGRIQNPVARGAAGLVRKVTRQTAIDEAAYLEERLYVRGNTEGVTVRTEEGHTPADIYGVNVELSDFTVHDNNVDPTVFPVAPITVKVRYEK